MRVSSCRRPDPGAGARGVYMTSSPLPCLHFPSLRVGVGFPSLCYLDSWQVHLSSAPQAGQLQHGLVQETEPGLGAERLL